MRLDTKAAEERALSAIRPIKRVELSHQEWAHVSARSKRTEAGNQLPEYYLVYFLLVELLDFERSPSGEKLAWSIPLEFEGHIYLVEYRKLGLGIFAPISPDAERQAARIVRLIKKGVRRSQPYFRLRAKQAVENSSVAVMNHSNRLYDRYHFFQDLHRSKCDEAKQNAGRVVETSYPGGVVGIDLPEVRFRQEAEWLAFAAIESFFSWTEHVFIHLVILQGNCTTSAEVDRLAFAKWSDKYRSALDMSDPENNQYHSQLQHIRKRFRNLGTHGAFGPDGEAFIFPSGTGAVPVSLTHVGDEHSYRFGGQFDHLRTHHRFVGQDEIAVINEFVEFIRSGNLEHAWVFIDAGLHPNFTADGLRQLYDAMESFETMSRFVEYESLMADAYANMEF